MIPIPPGVLTPEQARLASATGIEIGLMIGIAVLAFVTLFFVVKLSGQLADLQRKVDRI